jgi:hypothetical protein
MHNDPRFILERHDTATGARRITQIDKRPTQEELKQQGEAGYVLRRADGSLIKRWNVVKNRNGNLRVDTETPTGLEGITSANLARMNRAFERIVKHWPAKTADVRKINAELAARGSIVALAQGGSGYQLTIDDLDSP